MTWEATTLSNTLSFLWKSLSASTLNLFCAYWLLLLPFCVVWCSLCLHFPTGSLRWHIQWMTMQNSSDAATDSNLLSRGKPERNNLLQTVARGIFLTGDGVGDQSRFTNSTEASDLHTCQNDWMKTALTGNFHFCHSPVFLHTACQGLMSNSIERLAKK